MMKRFLIALQFLTIFPVKIKAEIKDEDYGRSLLFFPLVGLIIGLALAAIALSAFLPNLAKSAFILLTSIVITGGLHLDGFVDTCDGFLGAKPKEKILEIMRDSRIGAMGAIGLMGLLILKFGLIASISGEILWKVVIAMAVFSRWAQVLACGTCSYARESGKGKYFIDYADKRGVFIATFFTLALFFFLMQAEGVVLFFACAGTVYLFLGYIKKRIGGLTGDTIGAVNEFAEAAMLFLCVVYQPL